jgi:hypothetical protein
MRRLAVSVCACFALCAVVIVNTIERAIDWFLGVLPYQAPAFAFSDDPINHTGVRAAVDPQVERHEAGMSRRAAHRHI